MIRHHTLRYAIAMALVLVPTLCAAQRQDTRDDAIHKRIKINWGVQTRTHQVWDGQVHSDSGRIVRVMPFIRHGMLDDTKLRTPLSWQSSTYNDVEGIYLDIVGPPDAVIRVDTRTHPFSFKIGEINTDQPLLRMDGDIEIIDVTSQLLFQIAGLEYGRHGSGTATVVPEMAYVDSLGTWTVTFTAGDEGIPVGGGIRIAWHFSRSWGDPQFTDPAAPNYVTARTTGRATLQIADVHAGLFEYPFTRGRILVQVGERPLAPGDQISVTLGDRSGGSPGMQAPAAAEGAFEFRVESSTELPEGGFPIYRRIEVLPRLKIETRLPPERIFAVVPSTVTARDPITLKLTVEDRYRNTAKHFTGPLTLRAHLNGEEVYSRPLRLMPSDAGSLTVDGLVTDQPGIWRFTVDGTDGLQGQSNPLLSQDDADGEQLLWGDLHGHTRYSDGYGDVDQFFDFARQKSYLDFIAITDHDVELDAPDYTVEEMFTAVRAAIRRHNDPPRFLALWAWEWSPNRITETSQRPEGDHNVFFFQKKGYIFPTGDGKSNSIEKLYRRLNGLSRRTRLTVIPHVGGAIASWEFHDPRLQTVGEIYSVHGSFEQFGQIALDKGYRIGFVGAADSHNGQNGGFPPGNPPNHFVHGGLTAVYTAKLSDKSLHKAMTNRRVYATTGKRIIVEFEINNRAMGEVIAINSPPEIFVNAVGEQPIWKIDIIREGKVIHTKANEFAQTNTVHLLWRSQIERSDLLDFAAGYWARRLRIAHWQGRVVSPKGGLKLMAPLSFDYPKDKIIFTDADSINWASDTRGDYDGISFQVRDPADELHLAMTGQDFSTSAGSSGFVRFSKAGAEVHRLTVVPDHIPAAGQTLRIGPSDTVIILRGDPVPGGLKVSYTDAEPIDGESYYYVRVTQIDGEMAWSSPIWVQQSGDGAK